MSMKSCPNVKQYNMLFYLFKPFLQFLLLDCFFGLKPPMQFIIIILPVSYSDAI